MVDERADGRAGADPIDWEAWRRRLVQALDFRTAEPRFRDLFAAGGTFQDPSMAATTDIASAEASTVAFCPDFHQDLTSFRHGDDWATFEWLGTGTFVGLGDGSGKGAVMALAGMTMVSVDAAGLVTGYRDYLDRQEMIEKVQAAIAGPSASGPSMRP
jgi:hypothetical protein